MLHQPQSQSLTSAQFLTTAALAGNCCDCGFVVEGAPLFEEAGDADAVLGQGWAIPLRSHFIDPVDLVANLLRVLPQLLPGRTESYEHTV